MTSESKATDQREPEGAEANAPRRADLLRDVVVPALLALAIMLAVWWYWRVAVVDVGERAQESPAGSAGAGGR